MQNNGQENWEHNELCARLVEVLDETIQLVMRYVFEGKCRSPQELEKLFEAVNHALLMKNYLNCYNSNLVKIAEDFLAQFEQWLQEMQSNLY